MSEWKDYKLSDLMEIKYGKDHKHLADGSYPLFGSGGIMRYVEKSIYEEESILIPRKGTLSNLFYVNEPFWSVDTMFWSKIKQDLVLPKYLYYTLKTYNLAELNVGSAVPSLTTEVLNKVLISIPDKNTQTSIAEILASLDDKIELNNKINQELETLAQTLFKQWFIDFEFPNENGEPYKSSGGEMVESELGEIPKGWEIVKVQDLEHKLQTGTRPKGGVGGITQGVPSIGAESIKKLGYYDFSKVKFVTEEFAAKMKRGKVEGYELLIYKDGGKPGTFIPHFSMFGEGFPFDSFFINEHVFLLDFFDKHFNSFCYFYFDSEYVRPVFENNGGKAAIPGINQEDVKNLWVFNPNLETVKLFGEFAHSSVSTILKNCKENIQLTNLRDTLLPKLISGELEFSQTQTTA
jgi:type I restriction enzyme S subunit